MSTSISYCKFFEQLLRLKVCIEWLEDIIRKCIFRNFQNMVSACKQRDLNSFRLDSEKNFGMHLSSVCIKLTWLQFEEVCGDTH